MDAADPFVSSTNRLLPGTLGLPVPVASPSKADWALIRGLSGTLKGSSELIEQSKFVRKGYGDIRMVYQDDGGKDMAAANCIDNLLRRRSVVDRKQHRFTMKYPMSQPLPVVDRSVLDTIADPDEYFAMEVQLNEAEAEIKRLNGEDRSKRALNFEPVQRERRNPSRPRKSYCFILDAHAASTTMVPASQSENMTESQISQDDEHASVCEHNDQSVPANKSAILDSLVEADPFAEKDEGDEITKTMAAFHSFDGPNKIDFLRKTFRIGEIRVEKSCRRDSVLGGDTAQRNPQEMCALESALPENHRARVSDLANRIFRDSAVDKHKDISNDGEFEGSPDIVMPEQSRAHDSFDVFTTDESFCAREKVRQAPGPSAKSAEHVPDPEPNMPNCDSIDHDPCSRHTISTEKYNVPGDSTTEKSNNESVSSFHHLEDASAEVLANTPGRDVAPVDIASTSHSYENNIQHQEVVEEDGVAQDKSTQSLEIPLEDIGSQNQSQAPDGAIKNLIAELRTALSPTKEKMKKAAQLGEIQQQPKRMKKAADDLSHSLEMPQADFDSENQPCSDDVNTEKNTLLPSKEKTQEAARRRDNQQQPTRRKKGAARRGKNKQQPKMVDSHHSLEVPQSDFDLENQAPTHDVTIEQQTVVMSNAPLQEKPKGQKEAQRKRVPKELNKRKSLADAGLEWQSGVRRSTRVRHRPLEQWRNEKFVYARIHKTLATVVGVKSFSPDEAGKRALKVKSFVPEQYSDIVAFGGRY